MAEPVKERLGDFPRERSFYVEMGMKLMSKTRPFIDLKSRKLRDEYVWTHKLTTPRVLSLDAGSMEGLGGKPNNEGTSDLTLSLIHI